MTTTPIINKRQRNILLTACLISVLVSVGMLIMQRINSTSITWQVYCFRQATGWGYDILADNKIVIHQPTIPGVQGTKGFATQQQAQLIGGIVIEKIKSGQQPIITPQLLQHSGILLNQ